jgi:hypothetical protein
MTGEMAVTFKDERFISICHPGAPHGEAITIRRAVEASYLLSKEESEDTINDTDNLIFFKAIIG